MTRRDIEHQEQARLVKWVDEVALEQYPELAWLFAVPNGGRRDAVTGAKLKAEGVKPGVPDLVLPVPRGGYHGLWIEMKTEDGRMTPEQKEWQGFLRAQGYRADMCRGSREAAQMLLGYLDERLPAYEAGQVSTGQGPRKVKRGKQAGEAA